MTKHDLMEEVAQHFPHLSQQEVKAAVETVFAALTQALAAGKRIELRGVGSFGLKHHQARAGHNPEDRGGHRRAGQDRALLQSGSGAAQASGRDGGAGERRCRGEERQTRRTTAKGWGGDVQHGMSLGRSGRKKKDSFYCDRCAMARLTVSRR
jgi:nucleoid DNA-binding protein